MFAVMKKEFKSYFLSPIGYIFIGTLLIMFSGIFFINIFLTGISNFEYLFDYSALVLTVLVPVLTMRMFSEERKSGTEQLLMTSPRSILSIVLGKFFAAACMILIMELLTLGYFAILSYFGEPSVLVAFSTLVGVFLLCLAYISLGMFVSSITENQVISCVLSVAILLATWLLLASTKIGELFAIIYKFADFLSGIISISSTITLLSFTILFIVLTIITLQRRKSIR